MACVNRDRLLSSLELQKEHFEVQGYEDLGYFVARELTGIEQMEVVEKINGSPQAGSTLGAWIAAGICDDLGNKLFDEADVAKFPANLLMKLFEQVESLNRLNLETEIKNSETDLTDNS